MTDRATGVVTGVGKGLIGVVTKPISGTAEFISQTGHGKLSASFSLQILKKIFDKPGSWEKSFNTSCLSS